MRGCHAAPRAAHRAPLLALFAGVGRQRLNNGSTDRKGHWRASGPSLNDSAVVLAPLGEATVDKSVMFALRNPKLEFRNPKQVQNPNFQISRK